MSKQLEERFFEFAKNTRDFCRKRKWDIINIEYIRQLIRPSGSVGANYIEASDDLGKADEKMKIKIARREGKESIHWLRLILSYEDAGLEERRNILIDEATQIKNILSAILLKL
jgi:four helix bundle protein